MIPSDENVSEIWKHRDYFGRSDLIEELVLWGLAQRARAMRAEWTQVHFAGGCMRQFCPDKEKHDWTDAQWLQAAAESVGIKLEEK